MSQMNAFTDGLRAYRRGEYARAAEALEGVGDRQDLPGRLARYYRGMAHRAIGLAALAEGRHAEAAEHLRWAVALIGNRADLSEYLVAAYVGAGQVDQAAEEASTVARCRPDSVAARVHLAQTQWRSGRRVEAMMTLREALRALGDRAELHLNLGLFHAAEEDFDLACRHLARAVECDCTCREAWRCLALAEAARGGVAASARALQRACILDPTDLLAAYQLCLAAEASAQAGHPVTVILPERAAVTGASEIRQLAEYAVGEMDFIAAFLALPPGEADEELLELILSVLQTALTAHPGYADVHYYAGQTCRRLGRPGRAAEHLRRAVEINPKYQAALMELADLEGRRGSVAKAIALLERAVQAGADYPDVHARLGDLLSEAGMSEAARAHYRQALEIHGGFARAEEGLRRLAA